MANPLLPQPVAPSPLLASIAGQTQVDFELDFFNAILDKCPEYLEVLRAHAKNLAQVRRHQEGLEFDRRITRLRPQDSLARYNLACCLALTRRDEEAMIELRKAVEMGYRDFAYMRQDRDLDHLRRDPRFKALIREYEPRRR